VRRAECGGIFLRLLFLLFFLFFTRFFDPALLPLILTLLLRSLRLSGFRITMKGKRNRAKHGST